MCKNEISSWCQPAIYPRFSTVFWQEKLFPVEELNTFRLKLIRAYMVTLTTHEGLPGTYSFSLCGQVCL